LPVGYYSLKFAAYRRAISHRRGQALPDDG
jgi:hypothetical protein